MGEKQRPPRLGWPDVCGLAAAAVVIVAAAAAVVAAAQAVAVVAAAAEQQDQNDDPPAATVTPGTVVTHSHYLQQGFVTAFAVHSMLFPRPKKVRRENQNGGLPLWIWGQIHQNCATDFLYYNVSTR